MSAYHAITKKVKRYIGEKGLIKKGDGIIVAVSGGVDSVVLLTMLKEIEKSCSLTLVAAHVNYRLRGKESGGDAEFVRNLAMKLKIPYEELKVSPKKVFRKVNLQEKAREIRYQFFNDVAKKYDIKRVALGHNATDQAETFLMRMIRGSGMTGISGIRPVTLQERLVLIRPLLGLQKAEILNYAKSKKIKFREDSTNLETKYLRNKIRHGILPLINDLNPQWVTQISNTAAIFQEEEDFWRQMTEELFEELAEVGSDNISVNRPVFVTIPRPLRLRLLRRIAMELSHGDYPIPYHHVMKMDTLAVNDSSSRRYHLPKGLVFKRRTDTLVFSNKI